MPNRECLLEQIERQRGRVLDLEIAVKDARAQVDRGVEALRCVVFEHDRALIHMQHLIELASEAA